MLCVVGVVYQRWGHGESNGGIPGQRAITWVPTLACVCQPHCHFHTDEAARLPGQSVRAFCSQSLVYLTVTVIGRFACYLLNSLSLGRSCFICWWFGKKELILYMYLFVSGLDQGEDQATAGELLPAGLWWHWCVHGRLEHERCSSHQWCVLYYFYL